LNSRLSVEINVELCELIQGEHVQIKVVMISYQQGKDLVVDEIRTILVGFSKD